jgi:hypothetical protein
MKRFASLPKFAFASLKKFTEFFTSSFGSRFELCIRVMRRTALAAELAGPFRPKLALLLRSTIFQLLFLASLRSFFFSRSLFPLLQQLFLLSFFLLRMFFYWFLLLLVSLSIVHFPLK